MYLFEEQTQNSPDPNTKRGIIILSIFLLALIGFFGWYNYRSTRLTALSINTNDKKEGFLSNLLKPDSSSENTLGPLTDNDSDGLSNEEEISANTNSSQADSDNDGLTDREEIKVYSTNPLQADSDSDSINDGEEIRNRRDPNNSSPSAIWPPTPAVFSSNQ